MEAEGNHHLSLKIVEGQEDCLMKDSMYWCLFRIRHSTHITWRLVIYLNKKTIEVL